MLAPSWTSSEMKEIGRQLPRQWGIWWVSPWTSRIHEVRWTLFSFGTLPFLTRGTTTTSNTSRRSQLELLLHSSSQHPSTTWSLKVTPCERHSSPRDPLAFIQDPAVLEAAHLLPPQMLHIKNRVNLLAKQKQALREQGYDPKELQREMENKLYLAFRSLGCRTAMWDGNL